MKRHVIAAVASAAVAACAPAQSAPPCIQLNYNGQKVCSLTGVNGSCTLIVDRMNPATPPTIYARRGAIITLKVINPSPLDKLELDETSIKTTAPVDSVQGLASVLTQLGKFVLPLPQAIPAVQTKTNESGENIHGLDGGNPPYAAPTYTDIQKKQDKLLKAINRDVTLDDPTIQKLNDSLKILRVLIVAPVNGCVRNSAWSDAIGKLPTVKPALTVVRDGLVALVGPSSAALGQAGPQLTVDARTLAEISGDIDAFKSESTRRQKDSDNLISSDQKSIDAEVNQTKRRPDAAKIAGWKAEIKTTAQDAARLADTRGSQLDQLNATQAILTDMLATATKTVKTVFFPAQDKLTQLIAQFDKLPAQTDTTFTINDILHGDTNDQTEAFMLNAANVLADPVKVYTTAPATDSYSQSLADSLLSTPPTLTAVAQVTVQYVSQPEMEITTGILVPVLPYKSYKTAPQSAGSSTNVAQESHTYTVVPTLNLNFRLGDDKFTHTLRYGWFGTVAVGYNPATSMVEFGVGPSFAVKSAVFSVLADIGRDTQLATGFVANQPLPTGATSPTTNGVWSVKPSIGFSIRLPFGSSSGK